MRTSPQISLLALSCAHRSTRPASIAGLGVAIASLALVGCGATKSGGGPALLDDAGTDAHITDGGVFTIDANSFESGTYFPVQLSPDNAILFIDKTTGTPVVQPYTATFTPTGGTPTDVTASAMFTTDTPAAGTFSGSTFTSALTLPGGVLGLTIGITANTSNGAGQNKATLINIRKTPDPITGARDFFFTVPYKSAPVPASDTLKFGTNIGAVDVAINMDTTGSMGGEISTLISSLTGTVFPGLQKAIPDVGIAIVDHKDTDNGCGPDPWVVNVRQVVTTDISAATAAASAMSASGGCDTPEGQIASMFYTLTGEPDSILSPALAGHTPATGTSGGVDFRAGAVPVVVEISDASWHDPSGHASLEKLEATFNSKNAKFVDVFVNLGGGDSSIPQAQELCDATNSFLPKSAFGGACPNTQSDKGDGTCRLMFAADSSGAGVDTSIVSAIQSISVGSTYDVAAVLSNDPTNAGAVDATQFIAKLRAMSEGSPTDGCAAHATYDSTGGVKGYDDTFKQVTVGQAVCFEVDAKENTAVQPKSTAQFFNAFIDMEGMPGNVKLGDRRTVVFLVPPDEGTIIQ